MHIPMEFGSYFVTGLKWLSILQRAMDRVPKSESVLALYFSRENVGLTLLCGDSFRLQCSQINHLIFRTSEELLTIIERRQVNLVVTNNDKSEHLWRLPGSIRVVNLSEKGLKDDVIESSLSIFKVSPDGDINDKKMFIRAMLEQSNRISPHKEKVRALGLMVYFLCNEGAPGVTEKIYIDEIEFYMDGLTSRVPCSESQLSALDIIKEEIHPSLVKGKGRSKQGFSILNLFETTLITQNAKKMLRHIFRNPIYDAGVLSERRATIRWVRTCLCDKQAFLRIFRSVHSVADALKRFKEARSSGEDWRKLTCTVEAMLILCKVLAEKVKVEGGQIPRIIKEFVSGDEWEALSKLLGLCTSNLEFSPLSVRKGVDPKLDELKRLYDNLPHLLTLYARQENWDNDLRIVFMAQIGYLISVPLSVELDPEVEDDWNLQFSSASARFYSSSLTEKLDAEYGDIYGEITDREKQIIFDLELYVSEFADKVEKVLWQASEFECMWGISETCKGLCQPRMSSESLIVVGGWHLLLAQDAIDNHAFSFDHSKGPLHRIYNSEENIVNSNYSNRVMLLSGPNASGKTVYMKQTAIIIYLAHLGFFVPAQLAEVPYVDRFIFVEPSKSVYQVINGFESEIQSLSRITAPRTLSNKSLVMIDELGSSIDASLSVKIFAATVNYLSNNESRVILRNRYLGNKEDKFKIPICFLVTHLTEMVSRKLTHEDEFVRHLTMAMEQGRVCLYKVKPGLVKKGYGIDCAKSIMSEEFIANANKYWTELMEKY